MKMLYVKIGIAIFVAMFGTGRATAQEREILVLSPSSGKIREVAESLRNPNIGKLSYEQMTWTTDYFVRIAPRNGIVAEDRKIQPGAILGTKPFVFMTTAACIRGRSLLEIYEDIGYDAKEIIRSQRNEDTVAIVFRYPNEITITDVRDGHLCDDWIQRVYTPTWANVNSLFARLAVRATIEPGRRGEFAPEQLFFRSPEEKCFVLGFPEEGKQRIISIFRGAVLKAIGGGTTGRIAELLEEVMSIFNDFQGNGRTHNEVLDPDDGNHEAGLIRMRRPQHEDPGPAGSGNPLSRATLQLEDSYMLPQLADGPAQRRVAFTVKVTQSNILFITRLCFVALPKSGADRGRREMIGFRVRAAWIASDWSEPRHP